ncbi:MAG: ATP-binding protein [Planctomycetaceae bacterium]|nr:ATP-binding protein [Planctomycetaceae bacterium]
MSKSFEFPEIRRPLTNGIHASWLQVDPRIITVIRETIQSNRWPLTLWGPPGSGKTCVAALTLASWPTSHDTNVRFFTVSSFVSLVQQARRDGSVLLHGAERECSESDIWRVQIEQKELLVLDDLGTRSPTDSQFEIIFEMIDRRRNRPLIISTNHSPEALSGVFDDRIKSRLLAGTVLEMLLQDRRPANGRRCRIVDPDRPERRMPV